MWNFLNTRKFLKKRSLGTRGEDDAVRYLKKRGYRIIDRNVRNTKGYAVGEIDIVARKGEKCVFVEVKARTQANPDSLPPETSITQQKLFRLERVIHRYRSERRDIAQLPYQLDAIIIEYARRGNRKSIRHIEHIFL